MFCVCFTVFAEVAAVIVNHADKVKTRIFETFCVLPRHSESITRVRVMTVFRACFRVGKRAFNVAKNHVRKIKIRSHLVQKMARVVVRFQPMLQSQEHPILGFLWIQHKLPLSFHRLHLQKPANPGSLQI